MPCYHPVTGWRGKEVNPASGKRKIVFDPRDAWAPDAPVVLPCGRCVGCRLERSRQWAMRCCHEASLYERNCFITLTYDDVHLPLGGCLDKSAFQKFMKRLRKRFGDGIRYFHCGEYGERFARPHYHACLFNFDFEDKILWSVKNGNKLYISEALRELWPFGFNIIGDVTFESAAYVARYVTKKITGPRAEEFWLDENGVRQPPHYLNEETGELRPPEYVTMSRRPGIGRDWYEKFTGDVYPGDYVVFRGQKMRPPKYYDSRFEVDNPNTFAELKLSRQKQAKAQALNSTWERLAVREEIQLQKFKLLKRGMENV